MIAGRFAAFNSAFLRMGYAMQAAVESSPAGTRAMTLTVLGALALGSLALLLLRRNKKFPFIRLTLALALLVCLALEAAGIIDLAKLVAGWLLFQA
jgi:LPXTG-motif cell wall-anchored protein